MARPADVALLGGGAIGSAVLAMLDGEPASRVGALTACGVAAFLQTGAGCFAL